MEKKNRSRAYAAVAFPLVALAVVVASLLTTRTQNRSSPASRAEWQWFGAEVSALSPDEASQLGLPADRRGVIVDGLTSRGAAAQAGIQLNDVVAAVNDQPVLTADELWARMAEARPGSTITLDVSRSGRSMKVAVPYQRTQPFALA